MPGFEIDRVWRANREVYGVRKVWKQLNREGFCSLHGQRLIETGLQGVVRGRRFKTTSRMKQPQGRLIWWTATLLQPVRISCG